MDHPKVILAMRQAQAEIHQKSQWLADLVPVLRRKHPECEFTFKPFPLVWLEIRSTISGYHTTLTAETIFKPYPFTEIKQAVTMLNNYPCNSANLV